MHIKTSTFGVRLARAAAALGLAALAAGCQREQVTHFRVPKDASGAMLASAGGMGDGGMGGGGMGGGMPAPGASPAAPAGDVPPPPRPAAALAWTLPKGWTQDVAGGMRYATLKPPVAGKVDVSVIVLPGPAGGELANVNRWRNQIGLPPLGEPELAGARSRLSTKAGPVSVYDFANEPKKARTVAALAEVGGSTWFLKLSGEADPVAAARPDFLRIVESLRRGAND